MSTATAETPEEQNIREILALANQLHPADREQLAWGIVQSLYPELRPEMFGTAAEVIEYLAAKPDAVIGSR